VIRFACLLSECSALTPPATWLYAELRFFPPSWQFLCRIIGATRPLACLREIHARASQPLPHCREGRAPVQIVFAPAQQRPDDFRSVPDLSICCWPESFKYFAGGYSSFDRPG